MSLVYFMVIKMNKYYSTTYNKKHMHTGNVHRVGSQINQITQRITTTNNVCKQF